MTVAAGEGPRDWKQSEAYTFPYAPGGIYARPGQLSQGRSSLFGLLTLLLGVVALFLALVAQQNLLWFAIGAGALSIACGIAALVRMWPTFTSSTALPIAGMVIGGATALALFGGYVGTLASFTTVEVPHSIALPSPVTPTPTPTTTPGPTPARFATAQDERAALLQHIPAIAGALLAISSSGHPLPTSYVATPDGALVGEPSGQVLGSLPIGTTVSWTTDSTGRVAILTFIGPTFGTRLPIDVGSFSTTGPPASTT
jgi:hypothetical protein